MILTAKVIEFFRGKNSTRLRNLIALEMDKSVHAVERWISENRDNGPLTTASVTKLIQEETELTASEILEETVTA